MTSTGRDALSVVTGGSEGGATHDTPPRGTSPGVMAMFTGGAATVPVGENDMYCNSGRVTPVGSEENESEDTDGADSLCGMAPGNKRRIKGRAFGRTPATFGEASVSVSVPDLSSEK